LTAIKFQTLTWIRRLTVIQRSLAGIALLVLIGGCDDGAGRVVTSPLSSSTAKVGFVVQPSTTTVGATITPAVQVALQNAAGVTVGSTTSNITVAILSGPSGARLNGVTTRAAVNGVATFNDLSIDKTGGFTLTATSGNMAAGTSAAFSVNP
jgi:hypothetical protein